jgi:hypothetical protein
VPRLIALDIAVDRGGANPIYECRLTHSNDVRPANLLTCGNRCRRLVPSAGHIQDGNAGDLGIYSGRLVVEADYALG